MPGKTLLVLGCGPGIGVAVPCIFSVRGFTHVALVARNEERLKKYQDEVLDAIQERGYSCQVKIFPCDLADLNALRALFQQLESFGSLNCVFYNAARVAPGLPLEEDTKTIEKDFAVTNLALYETAKWAIPILKKATPDDSPSFIVTSTNQLWKETFPQFMSLSMVKSAQRALVSSLHAMYGQEVHIALLSVGGIVSPKKKNLSPANIAETCYELYKQPKATWSREVEVNAAEGEEVF